MQNNSLPHPAESLVLSKIPEDVINLARGIRLAVFDVDGVLTDGGLVFNENGECLKEFNALDGHGLRLLQNSGIRVALITGRNSPITSRRAAELGIAIVKQNARNKQQELTSIAESLNIELSQVAYMGDDIIDLPAMQISALSVSVPSAPSYIQDMAHWVTQKTGGHGAAREFCDVLLASQGLLGTLLSSNITAPGHQAIQ